MKSFAFGLAVALTFSWVFYAHDALPMVCAWALYAWVREMGIQRYAVACQDIVDEADVESVEDPATVRPMTVPPPLPRSMDDE